MDCNQSFINAFKTLKMMLDTRPQVMLRRENYDLKQQLKEAHCTIITLRSEIQILRKQLSKYEAESTPQEQHLRTPKMQMEQHFSGSSEQQQHQNQQSPNYQSPNAKAKYWPLSHSSSLSNRYHQESHKQQQERKKQQRDNNKSSNKKVIISIMRDYSDQDSTSYKRKEINKVLKKSSERKKENQDIEVESPFKAISTKEIQHTKLNFFNRDYSSIRSEKVLFRKMSNSRPIFDCFFVTGITKEGPCITYSYPHGTEHNFSAYLSLMYGQNSLRQPDLSPSNSRSKININHSLKENPFSIYIKDTFVIPIIKPQSKNSDKDFLIVCQVQESVLEKQYLGWHFPRYYCFLSQWKFFSQFRKLISQLIDRIHVKKKCFSEVNEMVFTKIIQDQVQQGISFLYNKTTDYNKTLDCCIGGSGLKFSVDIPPVELSYQMIEKYQPWQIINSMVQFKLNDEENPTVETQLLGVLIAYALSEVKIVLYSTVKSKISEAILQLLEIIRPLTYVNPIMIATLKDQHQNYLDAPMSIILGLWAEQKKSSRQKIEIFMNKKMNLMGMIEKAKLEVLDGIVINLDTGLIFGGGINPQLTQIGCRINRYRSKFTKSRQTYKMIQKMMLGKYESQESRQIWGALKKYIEKTQTYCYYQENREE